VEGVSNSKPLADLQQFIAKEIREQTGKEK